MPEDENRELDRPRESTSEDEIDFSIDIPPGSGATITYPTPDGEQARVQTGGGAISISVRTLEPTEGDQPQEPTGLPPRAPGEGSVRAGGSWREQLSATINRRIEPPRSTLRSRFSSSTLSARLRSMDAFLRRRGMALFLLSCGIYLFTRLYRIEDFPIYFFTDEAVHTVLAGDFLRDRLHDYTGTLLPAFFKTGSRYSLGLSVYLQLLPTLLFGKSVAVTRGVSALVSSTSAVAVSLIMKRIFKARVWWTGVLLLAVVPTWFLHSRTAFEYALLVTCFAWMLYFYLLYRTQDPRNLYPCLLFAILGFYSYNPGQIIIPSMGLLMALIDLRYHWRHRRTVAKGLVLILIGTLPYVRFRLSQPVDTYFQLRTLNSYWVQPITLAEKLRTLADEFLFGINPGYWFLPGKRDLIRHIMDSYGHFHVATFPFAALGLWTGLRRGRFKRTRVLLAAMPASVMGGAIVAIGITRVLTLVIPITIFVGLGLDQFYRWLARALSRRFLATAIFTALAIFSLGLLREALINGPLWFDDYGMGGLQYGARQTARQIDRYLEENPGARVLISPNWANGVDVIRRFFFPDDAPIDMGGSASVLEEAFDLDDRTLFVLPPPEYEELRNDPKIGEIRIEAIEPYPDGSPGFYFVTLRYSDQAAVAFEQEREERRRPRVETYTLLGLNVQVEHPYFDSGELKHIFDHDSFTLARVYEANPALFKIAFPVPVTLTGLELTTGSMDFELDVRIRTPDSAVPITYSRDYTGLPDDPTVMIDFDPGPIDILGLEVEILSTRPSDPVKIHIRDLTLR